MKKYFYISIIFIIMSFFIIGLNIGNDRYFLNKYKKYVPQNFKNFLKEKIFVYQNQNTLKQQISFEINQSQKFKNQALLLSLNKLYFNLQSNEKNISNLKIFKSGVTDILSRRGYLHYNLNKLYFVTGSGKIFKGNFYEEENIILSNIDSNFHEKVGLEYLLEEKSIVNHFLVDKNKIFISFVRKIKKNCYGNSILVAEINDNFLEFEELFAPEKCLSNFFNYSSGGRLENLNDTFLILTIGDFDPYSENEPFSQYDIDLRGKVLKINKNSGSYHILSKGNRNPQGLFLERQNDLIFLSDHGPKGGDEINVQKINENKIENFGWPIASYGEHYVNEDLDKISIFNVIQQKQNNKKLQEKYIKQPLNKSHFDMGFNEPLIFWGKNNLAPTQLIVIYNSKIKEYNIYVSSLGNIGDLHKSIHHLRFNNQFKLIKEDFIKLDQRIRDLIFIRETNSLMMYLEESSSLAVLKLTSNYNLK